MYLVFDVGGTFIKHAVMSESGERIEKDKFPTPNRHDDTMKNFIDAIGTVYDSYKDRYELEGIAVSVPGQVDVERGIVYGGGCLPYLDRTNVEKNMSRRCGGLRVALENDAKCAALAETWIGNAKDCKSSFVVVFGTGVGGGLVIDGKIHRGQDMAAGEISFLLDTISMDDLPKIRPIEELMTAEEFEDFPQGFWNNKVSMMSLRNRICEAKKMEYEEVTGELIYEWAAAGDQFVIDTLEEQYLAVAKQLCNFYALFAPEIILVGGGISAQPKFMEGITKYVNQLKRMSRIFRSMKIDVCRFRNDSNLIGALYNYLQLTGKLDR